MKRRIMATGLVMVIIGYTFLGGCSNGDTEIFEFSYSNFFPSTHLNSALAEEWIEEIETRSEGRIVINYYPGGSLTAAAAIYDGVVQGISDIGMSCFAYTPGRFPVSELVDLPHGYPNGYVATMAANDYYAEFEPAEMDDVKPLYFHAHGPGVIITTQKKVSTLADLNGLILRATGIGANVVKALGSEGYGASQGETYELMARGVVDGSYTPREVLKGWNQAEVVKYVTNCYEVGNTTMMFVVMNESKWNALPSSLQKIISDVSSEWAEKHGMVWDYYDKAGIDHFLSLGQGREVVELSASEVETWKQIAVEPLIDQYITDKTTLGHDAASYEEYLLERVEYWSSRAPSLEESVAWVEENLAEFINN
ncbi:MAG: TRAP transporter substrate-binding protein [Dehalococcoidaceae bacterium]|nr:TRAP transporter substrate-binding protein [Dehalococcoidaceae bacterium]